jgi:hypothetical protein
LEEQNTLSPATGRSVMSFTGIYKPEELALLRKVLDDHCASWGIERASSDHEEAVYLVLSLFEKGAQTAEELKAALDAALAGDDRREA